MLTNSVFLDIIILIVLFWLIYGILAATVSLIKDWIDEVRFKKALKRGDIEITFVIFEESEEE
jgi:hypothetical protein